MHITKGKSERSFAEWKIWICGYRKKPGKRCEQLKQNQIDKSVIDKIQNDLKEIKEHLKKHDDQIDDSK